MFFGNKEKERQKKEAEEAARLEAEYEAKYKTKQERKRVEKLIVDVDKSIETMLARAASAKAEGYTEIFRQCILLIKTARARKKQAKMFLFQMEAMEQMQELSKSSSELLGSMNTIMTSLGKLSLDKSVMMNTQRDFAATQRELDKQSANLDQFLSGMEMHIDDSDMDTNQFSDEAIEEEIDAYMMGKQISSAPVKSSTVSTGNSELDDIAKQLNSF